MAGYDDEVGAELYFMDYLATMTKMPCAAHGYGAYFCISVMDRYYSPGKNICTALHLWHTNTNRYNEYKINSDMTEEEAIKLMKRCVKEIQLRLVINLPAYKLRIIDKNGIRDLPDIVAEKE